MTTSEDKIKSEWEDNWSNTTIEKELATCKKDDLLPIFLKYLPKDGIILEGGCGLGRWIIELRRRGYNTIGVDHSPTTIERLKNYNSPLKVEVGDILHLRFAENYFDSYISLGVIEHFSEGPERALKEAYRVLKPNGLLFVTVPAYNIIRMIKHPIAAPMSFVKNKFKETTFIRRLFGKKSLNIKQIRQKREKGLLKEFYKRYVFSAFNGYDFYEYRYRKGQLEEKLEEAYFEVILSQPIDHKGGLWHDFKLLGSRNLNPMTEYYRLSSLGKRICNLLKKINPWISNHMVLCVARKKSKVTKLFSEGLEEVK